jgi:hypothetical protein
MAYFNGGLHGWNDRAGYHAPAPTTAIYCDDCAETAIPLPAKTGDRDGARHWSTGFKWAPRYGAPCTACGKDC